jgi:uncharacterized protein YigE (DUF2233 family)
LFSSLLFLVVLSHSCGSEVSGIKTWLIAKTINYRGHSFDCATIDPTTTEIQLFLAAENGRKYRSIQKLKQSVEENGNTLLFAMNGGMYLKDGSPQGLYIENEKELKTLDTISNAYGNFYLQPNGVFYLIEKNGVVCTTGTYLKTKPKPKFATQSGPMLVINNQIHPVFQEDSENVHIRNGVGIDRLGNVVFAISNEKVNLFDFAMFFKEKLHCGYALYLDGFVSKAFIPQLKREELNGNFGVIIGVAEKTNSNTFSRH